MSGSPAGDPDRQPEPPGALAQAVRPPDPRPPFRPAAIRGVLFDAYGTLFRFGDPEFRALNAEILAAQSLGPDFEEFHRSWVDAYSPSGVWASGGANRREPYREHVLNGPVPPWHSQWEIWRRQYEAAFRAGGLEGDSTRAADDVRAALSLAAPYDDAHPAVEELAGAGFTIGLLSNADEDFLQRALSRARLRFSVIQSSESLRIYKPHRAVFLAACERLGCAPAETLYVGDSPIADVGGAHNAGLRTVWISRSPRSRPVEADDWQERVGADGREELMSRLPEPDVTVHSLSELGPVLSGRP